MSRIEELKTENEKLREAVRGWISLYKGIVQLHEDLLAEFDGEAYEVMGLRDENVKLREALELIAAPKRPDGTYNRSREACEQVAREAIKGNE